MPVYRTLSIHPGHKAGSLVDHTYLYHKSCPIGYVQTQSRSPSTIAHCVLINRISLGFSAESEGKGCGGDWDTQVRTGRMVQVVYNRRCGAKKQEKGGGKKATLAGTGTASVSTFPQIIVNI